MTYGAAPLLGNCPVSHSWRIVRLVIHLGHGCFGLPVFSSTLSLYEVWAPLREDAQRYLVASLLQNESPKLYEGRVRLICQCPTPEDAK